MTPKRFHAIVDALNSMERRVFDALPSAEYLTREDVTVLLRQQGRNVAVASVERTLRSLESRGVVLMRTSMKIDSFMRVTPRADPSEALSEELSEAQRVQAVASVDLSTVPADDAPAPDTAPVGALDILDRLAGLAERVRSLGALTAQLASDIDDAALDVRTQIDGASDDSRKLAELRRLLQGI